MRKKIALALTEQVFFSLSMLAVQFAAMARLSIDDFLIFSLFYSLYIFFNIAVQSLFVEPYFVLVGEGERLRFRDFIEVNAVLAGLLFLSFGIFSFLNGGDPHVYVSAFFFSVGGWLLWVQRAYALRSGLYVRAMSSSAVVIVVSLIIYFGFSAIGIAKFLLLVAFVFFSCGVFLRGFFCKKEKSGSVKGFYGFGFLNFLSQVCLWVMTNGLPLVAVILGVAHMGPKLRVLMMVVLPAQYLNIALSNYWLPKLAAAGRERSLVLMDLLPLSVVGLVLTIAYVLFACAFYFLFFYELIEIPAKYIYYLEGLGGFLLLPIFLCAINSLRVFLKAIGGVHYYFISCFVGFFAFAASLFLYELVTSVYLGLLVVIFVMFYFLRIKYEI